MKLLELRVPAENKGGDFLILTIHLDDVNLNNNKEKNRANQFVP